MKVSPLAFLLLLPLISTSSTTGRLLSTSRNACLSQMNSFRAQYAHRHQIANLNQLVYDKNLEKIIMQKLDDVNGCPTSSGFYSNSEDTVVLIFKGNTPKVHDLFDWDSSRMACFKSKCAKTGKDVNSFVVDIGSSSILNGAAGSRCPENRPSNENGLCAPIDDKRYQRKFSWAELFPTETEPIRKCVNWPCTDEDYEELRRRKMKNRPDCNRYPCTVQEYLDSHFENTMGVATVTTPSRSKYDRKGFADILDDRIVCVIWPCTSQDLEAFHKKYNPAPHVEEPVKVEKTRGLYDLLRQSIEEAFGNSTDLGDMLKVEQNPPMIVCVIGPCPNGK